jgi:hypothetical protein
MYGLCVLSGFPQQKAATNKAAIKPEVTNGSTHLQSSTVVIIVWYEMSLSQMTTDMFVFNRSLILSVVQGMKPTYLCQWHPLFPVQWDRSDQQLPNLESLSKRTSPI